MMGYAGHNANANARGSLRQPGAAASTSFRIIRRAWRGVVLHCVGSVVGHGAWCGAVGRGARCSNTDIVFRTMPRPFFIIFLQLSRAVQHALIIANACRVVL